MAGAASPSSWTCKLLNLWTIDRHEIESTAAVNKSQKACHYSGLTAKVNSINLRSLLCVCVVDLVGRVLIDK